MAAIIGPPPSAWFIVGAGEVRPLDQDDSRWVEVTPSQFTHEAEGLRLVRELLPSIGPYRAWSNFEFRDAHGKWHEVDLLVLGRRRMHLVELKYYAGTLTGDDHRWWRDQRDTEDSPLRLARRKAQRLASKLQDSFRDWAREKPGLKIPDVRGIVPFVQEAVYLHHPGLRCALPAACRMDLFGLDGHERDMGLPGISQRLLESPTDRQTVPPRRPGPHPILRDRSRGRRRAAHPDAPDRRARVPGDAAPGT